MAGKRGRRPKGGLQFEEEFSSPAAPATPGPSVKDELPEQEDGPKEQDDGSDEEWHEGGSLTEKPKAKKKKAPSLNLTRVQKKDVAEWYRQNEFLYNAYLDDYKDIELKQSTWKQKAKELGIEDWNRLERWVRTQRDEVGRLTDPYRKPSLSRPDQLTDRQKWVMDNFGFMSRFMRRHAVSKRTFGGLVSCDEI